MINIADFGLLETQRRYDWGLQVHRIYNSMVDLLLGKKLKKKFFKIVPKVLDWKEKTFKT